MPARFKDCKDKDTFAELCECFQRPSESRSGQRKTFDRLAATVWKAAANIGITDPILFLRKNPRRATNSPRVLRDGDQTAHTEF